MQAAACDIFRVFLRNFAGQCCNLYLQDKASFVQNLIYLGNLNDGPKDGDDKANKPTASPFESQSRYNADVKGAELHMKHCLSCLIYYIIVTLLK